MQDELQKDRLGNHIFIFKEDGLPDISIARHHTMPGCVALHYVGTNVGWTQDIHTKDVKNNQIRLWKQRQKEPIIDDDAYIPANDLADVIQMIFKADDCEMYDGPVKNFVKKYCTK